MCSNFVCLFRSCLFLLSIKSKSPTLILFLSISLFIVACLSSPIKGFIEGCVSLGCLDKLPMVVAEDAREKLKEEFEANDLSIAASDAKRFLLDAGTSDVSSKVKFACILFCSV